MSRVTEVGMEGAREDLQRTKRVVMRLCRGDRVISSRVRPVSPLVESAFGGRSSWRRGARAGKLARRQSRTFRCARSVRSRWSSTSSRPCWGRRATFSVRGGQGERTAARSLAVACRVAGVSRSAACEARRRRGASERLRARPGPLGAMSDRELLAEIRAVLAKNPFVGEGHPKVAARARRRGVCTRRRRVPHLTREAGLFAPTGRVRKRAHPMHDGTTP
jgi:hypothetical protein